MDTFIWHISTVVIITSSLLVSSSPTFNSTNPLSGEKPWLGSKAVETKKVADPWPSILERAALKREISPNDDESKLTDKPRRRGGGRNRDRQRDKSEGVESLVRAPVTTTTTTANTQAFWRPYEEVTPIPASNNNDMGTVEPEPGIHHHYHHTTISSTVPATTSQDGGPARGLSNEDELPGQTLLLLQRLNDRLTTLVTLDEQRVRRLENIEYRITKLEVQTQAQSDGVKAAVEEAGRRVQTIDWGVNKLETLLDVVRQDLAALKQGQTELKIAGGPSRSNDGTSGGLAEAEIIGKLQLMMASLYSTRGVVGSLQDDLAYIKNNLTHIDNATRALWLLKDQLLTKQYFGTALLDLKSDQAPPVFGIPNGLAAFAAATQATYAVSGAPESEAIPRDCYDVLQSGSKRSGVYRIQPPLASQPFFAYCDQETRGGGWTIIHNRFEGTVNFLKEWSDYKHGFGNLGGEFWFGLEKIHLLTNYKVNELVIELTDFNLQDAYAFYSAFAVGTEVEGYPISFLGSYEGDAGDSLIYHAGMKFSTTDRDNDYWPDGNCASSHAGAWWYNGCDTSNLNGRYLNGQLPASYEYQGMYWYDWHGPDYSLMKARMMVRPRNLTANEEEYFKSRTADESVEREKRRKAEEIKRKGEQKKKEREQAELHKSTPTEPPEPTSHPSHPTTDDDHDEEYERRLEEERHRLEAEQYGTDGQYYPYEYYLEN